MENHANMIALKVSIDFRGFQLAEFSKNVWHDILIFLYGSRIEKKVKIIFFFIIV